jgi:hypothetical protein
VDSRKVFAEEFRRLCEGDPQRPWTHVRTLSERGDTVEGFVKEHGKQSIPPGALPSPRLKHSKLPLEIKSRGAIDLQDDTAGITSPKLGKIMPDDLASDHRAFRMPGSHKEWAFRISGKDLPKQARFGKWKVYAVVKVESKGRNAINEPVFSAGVYDNLTKTYPAQLQATLDNTVAEGYKSYLIGETELSRDRDVFLSPLGLAGIEAVWVDRIVLVPAR